ncbi:MAG: hypothetical protein RIB78_07480 [Gammaproteobacteria bacterium]
MSSATQESGIAKYLAVIAPVLYLLNLLLLPGLAFLILAFLFIKYKNIPDSVARVQVRQNFYASIASGVAIVGISIVIITIGGFSSMYSWMIMLLYALSIHATLVLLGALSLAKGINRKPYVYPGLAFLSTSR